MKLRVLIAGLIFGAAALAADNGPELFQRAVTQERAAGNLEEAIKLYQRVAKEFASDRALAAKALVQEARCYEKLGQDKAVKVYEQVARDFGDQREFAATASARLAVLKQGESPAAVPTTMTQRKIDLPGSTPINSVARLYQTDGHRAIYKDDATGAVVIGDLAGKDKRAFFKPKVDTLDYLVPSRDFSMVLMDLTRPDGSQTTAVIKTDGTGYRDIGIDEKCYTEWSWDNRYVLLCENQPDGKRQLLRVSVADGEIRKLRESDSYLYRFSPDSNFIAYSKNPVVPGGIFVVPSQGGEPRRVAENARLVDWTRDGRYLVIASDRSGSDALYLLPMKDGKQAGEAIFIRYGSIEEGRTAAGGSLVYQSPPPAGGFVSWLGTLNSDGRAGEWKRLSLSGIRFSSQIAWSPDSGQITYSSANQAAGQGTHVVRVRDIANGEERDLYRGSTSPLNCIWAAQHPKLFCIELTPHNTSEMLSISIDSGDVERLGSLPDYRNLAAPSHDDRAIYVFGQFSDELIRWDIETQQPSTIDRSPGLIQRVSPDERWITRWEKGKIEVRPMSGGDWRPLVSSNVTRGTTFTPDGNWFVYSADDGAGKPSVIRVATTGGQPERVGDFPDADALRFLSISPDGQKIIATVYNPSDIWLLENFEPKQQAAR